MTTAALCIRIAARLGRLTLDVDVQGPAGPLVLIGPNGAGKSSLLNAMLGLLPVDHAFVSVGQTVLADSATSHHLPIEHRRLGYLPQDYALFPHMTVRENIAFALASASPRQRREDRADRVARLLTELELETHAHRLPQTLSGGEQQRVGLARALAVNPRALLLDEPLAALDVHARADVRTFLAGYLARLALPTILVTHDAADARALGHTIAVLENGKIVQRGTWAEIAAHPASPFVRAFVAST